MRKCIHCGYRATWFEMLGHWLWGRPTHLFAQRQTYGCHCQDCGRIWPCYEVPIAMEAALRAMKANDTCVCGSKKVCVLMPDRFEELKRERGNV